MLHLNYSCTYLIYADEKHAESSKSIARNLPSNMIFGPAQASAEFGILLSNVVKELAKNEAENLELIKDICSCLTVKKGDDLLFNEQQQEEINCCGSIRILFITKLRFCWRWDDIAFLKQIVYSMDTNDYCGQLIEQYEYKLWIMMKLQDIYECCQQEQKYLPEGFHKMVAIVQSKCFHRITLEEYRKFNEFVCQHCKADPYVISPFMSIEVRIVIVVS